MKRQKWLYVVATMCAMAWLAGPAIAQEATEEKAGGMDQEKMAEAMMLMSPGENHEYLDAMVGKWACKAKMWMDPEAPPAESEGSMECEWIMGGRYIQYDYHGMFMGMPFDGMGLTGYDNHEEKYKSIWVDSMSTAIFTETGTYDKDASKFTYHSEYYDPMAGGMVKGKSVMTIDDQNHYTVTMYKQHEGKAVKVLELAYTRCQEEKPPEAS